MKFCENLQMLRKEHNLSQELLAEKLNVSRQAVSKWESGQSYPEMDKIIAMCKIFGCSMDELVNESINDVKEEEKKLKNSIIYYLEEFLAFITKTVKMITTMSFKEFIRCVTEMFIIFIIILLLRLPVEYIGSLGSKLFQILPYFLSSFVIQVWYFILNLSYAILAIIVFVHIFKTRYLDNYENQVEVVEDDKEEEIVESKEEPIKKVRKIKERRDSLFPLFSILSKVFTFFMKSLTIAITLPFLVSLLMFTIFLVIGIGLMFNGVFYLGIIIALIAALVFNVFLVETLFNIIFDRKNNLKKLFIVLLSTIIGLGLGIGITTFDVANSKYIDGLPADIEKTSKSEVYNMSNDLIIDYWNNEDINYVEDETLTDKIKVEVKYYSDYSNPDLGIYSNELSISNLDSEQGLFSKIYKLVVKDLKEKQFHNYHLLYELDITISSSKVNIEKLKDNARQYYDHIAEEENNRQMIINQYEERIRYYQDEMFEYENKINELELENENQKNEYENELLEYKNKIQEYKDKINSLVIE